MITNLLELSDTANLHYSTLEDQKDLLAQVLSVGAEETGEEVLEDADDISKEKAAAQRAAGDITALTGAHGRAYMEYQANRGKKIAV